MKTIQNIKSKVVGFMLLFSSFGISSAYATHAAGMDIFYRHTVDSTYEFTLVAYRNCQGFTSTMPNPFIMNSKAASINKNFNTNLPQLPISGPGVPPLEPPDMYNCTESFNQLCYEEYVYRANWTSTGRAVDWIFSTSLCCRPDATTAPTNIAYDEQWIECGLNNKDFPDKKAKNWSPLWHNRRPNHPGYLTDTLINFLFRTLCAYNYYTLEMGAREYQNDSITYDFYVPQGTGGAPIAYINGWSFLTPLPTLNGPLTINKFTGVIPIRPGSPTGTGVYAIGIRAKEWRYDTIVSGSTFVRVAKQIGFVKRDMTLWIDDSIDCRRDSVHPKNITITNGGGKSTIDVFFSNGVPTDPNSRVRCESLSPDGSEFRLIDSSNYIAPFDTTVRSIGIHKATWTCYAGLTNKVTLHLAEPLKCQVYWIVLRIGTDLDVMESECGFLEPDSTGGKLTITKNVKVTIDTVPTLLSYCLPTVNPHPKLTASSNDTLSFPLDYYWAYRCEGCTPSQYDTIEGQDAPYYWAQQSGWYEVRVRDPLNCAGFDRIHVIYDTVPEIHIGTPAYCDKYLQTPGMPPMVWAVTDDTNITYWEWSAGGGLGTMGLDDTLKGANLIEGFNYTLLARKNPLITGALRCSSTYQFVWNRDSFPPDEQLYVGFRDGSIIELCISDDDTGKIEVWEDGVRQKYAPMNIQWYKGDEEIPGQGYTLIVEDTGRYMVHIEDSLGCWGRDTAWVTMDERLEGPTLPCIVTGPTGTFTFIWPEGTPVVENSVSMDGGLTWYPASEGFQHKVSNIQSQKFILGKGRVNSACEWTEMSTSLECPDAVYPPNVMTPNGDGLNEIFLVQGLELFDKSTVKVFDRWGNVVFSSDDYENTWDGGDLPEGTYYYILEVNDPESTVHKGILTILR